jgi:hypothetical protein
MTGKIAGLGVDPFEKVQLAWIDAKIGTAELYRFENLPAHRASLLSFMTFLGKPLMGSCRFPSGAWLAAF